MTYQNPPQDLNWLTAYLIVEDVEKAVAFYSKEFKFDTHQTVKNRDGKMVFARMRYKGMNFILGIHDAFEGEKDYGYAPNASGSVSPVGIYVYCDDLLERYKNAQKAKLEILVPLEKRFWGDSLFRVRDLNGYIWTFAKPTHAFDPNLLPQELGA